MKQVLSFLFWIVRCVGWVTDLSVQYIGNRPFLAWAWAFLVTVLLDLNWTVFGLRCLVHIKSAQVISYYTMNSISWNFFFHNNGFNTRFVEKQIQKFFNKQYYPSGFDAPNPSILNFFFVITLIWTILRKTSFWTAGFIR